MSLLFLTQKGLSMIYLAGDKHGERAIAVVRGYLRSTGREFIDLGFNEGASPDIKLQDFIPVLAKRIKSEPNSTGILSCGTGAGVEIGANRFSGIRASLCSSAQAAEWARVYDKANILCLAAWALEDLDIPSILERWFTSEYDGSLSRLEMFEEFDRWACKGNINRKANQ